MTAGPVAAEVEKAPKGTIGHALAGRDNALNAIRLGLASAVIVAHSSVISGAEPLNDHTWGPLGGAAVYGFFTISGYLIAGSRMRLSLAPYLWRRLLRLMPGFWACLIVVAFLFAPVAGFVAGDHWSSRSSAGYVVKNMALRVTDLGIYDTLATVPVMHNWNGSLWTLGWEALCYVGAGLLLAVPAVRRHGGWWSLGILAASTGGLIAADVTDAWTRLPGYFLAGMALWFWRDRLPCSWALGLGSAAVLAALFLWGPWQNLSPLPAAYVMLWLGGVLPTRVGAVNDISYGIYIYGWPVQQLVTVVAGEGLGHWLHAAVSMVLVLPFAIVSWWLVEKPALRLKSAVL